MGATSSAGNQNKETSYEVCEAGVFPARCIQVVELGTHDNDYKGEISKRKELMIVFELSELMQDGRPFTVKWQGTNTLSDKGKLFKMLSEWRGRAFTPEELKQFALKNILDKCCMVNITKEVSKKGKEYNKLVSVMPLPKGMVCADRYNELVDFGVDDINGPEFNNLWPWVQKIVMDSYEGKAYSDSTGYSTLSHPGDAF